MGGEENYKEFDTASIVTRDTLSVGKYTFRKRDLILGSIALIALLAVIILAIILAVEVGSKSSGSSQVNSNQTQQGNQAQQGGSVSVEFCMTSMCLRAAAYEKKIMRETVNPCADFYQFACGGYADAYPQIPFVVDQTPFNQILDDNVNKLLNVFAYPVERPHEESYERKLKEFVDSCTSHFDKMNARGKPLLDKIIKPMGGWYVLGDWDPAKFDLHSIMKKVHIDYWTAVFFSVTITPDENDWNKRMLEILYAGLGLNPLLYSDDYFSQQAQLQYQYYLGNISEMIYRDANMSPNSTLIHQFVLDVLEVETVLANTVLSLPMQDQPHDYLNTMTLDDVNQLTSNQLDLVDYFRTAFPDMQNYFTKSTRVAVLQKGFFHRLGEILVNYTSTDDGKRKLHNYMVCQVISRYAEDLSWDYVYAKRELNYYLTGVKDDSSGYNRCVGKAEKLMPEAINALFIENFIKNEDKMEGMDVMNMIKDEVIKGLRTLPWMSEDNKEQAINKVTNSLYKIGFPEIMVDAARLDDLYSKVTINVTDYLGNILSLNQASRRQITEYIASASNMSTWAYHIFNPQVDYINSWHDMIVTSAALQFPLFAHDGPAYYNYGGIGWLMATHLINAFDEIGSMYKLDKSGGQDWWTNTTLQRYMERKRCAVDAQKNSKLGPFTLSNGNVQKVNDTVQRIRFAHQMLAEASGLRLSFRAFKERMAKKGVEKIPVGFPGYSPEKLFFVAFAQANCQNTPDYLKWNQMASILKFPGDYRVNLAVSQLAEFRETFGCKAGDPLAPETTCTLF